MEKELTTGKMLREARIDRGLSKWQLADKMGLSREYIKDVERGKTEIDDVTFGEFCVALGIKRKEDLV
ncbi:hypothetical protein B8A46_05455 [Dolosigranulum pigrum]|uniref:helix-turn-helix domain-containing protein n=1 Tax=Dolosigranulum pigrum TaxID=29394 RepID=UPI000DBFFFBF|nr:helix-turn-helix transcriptional regulator [Dolosigranulum pigrum]RAN59829.1 hypothetical protein B8A46_05455 [Dolosigranulum pigrum]